MRKWVVLVAGALLSSALSAADIGGVRVDDKTSVGGQELVLNGAGIRKRVVFNVYVASLYLPQKAADVGGVLAKAPRRIRLDLLRTLSADALDRSAERRPRGEQQRVGSGRDQARHR